MTALGLIPKLGGRALPRSPRLGPVLLAPVIAGVLIAAVLTPGLAAGGTVRAVTFAGTTSQHAGQYGVQRLPTNQISFKLVGGTVRNFSIPWVATCTTANNTGTDALLERTLITSALPVHDGRFSATAAAYSFSPGPHQSAEVEQFALTGAFHGRRASGKLSVIAAITQDNPGGTADCQTNRPIRWSTVAGGRQRSLAYPALTRPQELGYIAYARTDPTTGTSAIWLSNATGGAAVQVTHPPRGASDTNPTLSLPYPGGSPVLAYERTVAGVSQIYATDPFDPSSRVGNTSAGGRVTDFAAGAHEPAISGFALGYGTIVFSVGSGADCSLWVAVGSGSRARAPRQLTDHGRAPGCDSAPVWSPDGRSIAFHRELTDAAGDPLGGTDMVVPAVGGTPHALNLPASATAFSWAPGSDLVFLSTAGPTSTLPCLDTVKSDGTGQRTILCAAGLTGRPVWEPDGNEIAFVQSRPDGSTEIATVSASGGKPVVLTNTPGISEDAPAWTAAPISGPTGGQPGPGVHARPQRPGR
jgi:WD40-like Beta Propeller Repeat